MLPHMRFCKIQYRKSNIESCVLRIQDRWSEKLLQLNLNNTEVIWFGSRANLRKLNVVDLQLQSVTIKPSFIVRVWLDSELTMLDHISRSASTCFYHLRRLWQLHGIISQATMQRIMSAFVLSRRDYCNAVLASLTSSSLVQLQCVLRTVVCLVTSLGPRNHITGKMMKLHCQVIEYRIKYKLCVVMLCRANAWTISAKLSRLYNHSLNGTVLDKQLVAYMTFHVPGLRK